MRSLAFTLAATALLSSVSFGASQESISAMNRDSTSSHGEQFQVQSAAEREALQDLAKRAEAELRGNILPFWLEHARDVEDGGFHGEISGKKKVRSGAPKGALLSSRILWTFSAAHRRFQDRAYLAMARHAYDDLESRFWDEEHGGVFWSVKANGRPQETRKQIYAQVFALYGYSEYFRATGDRHALDRAIKLFRLVEAHAYDPVQGGYFEAFERDWTELEEGTKSLMATPEPKSQNTMLHVMEAYTNLLRVWPDAELRSRLAELVDRMVTRVVDPKTNHLHLLMAADWSPRSDGISYGHDIEFSWLLAEAVEVLGDRESEKRMQPVSLAIARVTRAEGFDSDGGLFNEADPHGLTDAGKDWWPQAEAVVGFLNAYQLSGDAEFLGTARRSWRYIESRIVDRENGEWFWGRDEKGRVPPKRPKAGMWKCPYHNGRACLEVIDRVEKLLGESPVAK